MTGTPPSPTIAPVWQIDPARTTAWRIWDGETVVYDDLSGDTLKLDEMMTVIFTHLLKHPATTADLVAHLARALDLDDDPRLQRLTELALARLAGSGLARSGPGSRPGPVLRRQ